MAENMRVVVVYLILATTMVTGARAELLREVPQPDVATKVRIELKAEGKFRVQSAPETAPAKDKHEPRPLALKVESRYLFLERVLDQVEGRPARVGRKVLQAVSVVKGEVRPFETSIRPEVMMIITEPKGAGYESFSPGGPLNRSELELVQGPGDPMSFWGLFSTKEVKVGDTWTVADEVARSLSGYDSLVQNQLEVTLKSLDEAQAELTIKGQVRGSALGGDGAMGLIGSAVFDRKANQVKRLRVDRAEIRQPGPVETGLDMQSTLTIDREPVEIPAELSDSAVGALPKLAQLGSELLIFTSPDGTYTFLHDRAWHLASDDIRQVVFKKLDRGDVVAQCNLVVGPNAGKGRHQDVTEFREDVKKALGVRFVSILGAGEVEGAPAGNYRYKVAVQGREGELGLVWYYYLVASPAGDQLLVTFTLGQAKSETFGEADQQLIGRLEWTGKPRR